MKRPARQGAGKFGDTVSVQHYAEQYGQSVAQVQSLLSQGKLPFMQIAGEIRIDCSRIEKPGKTKPS